MNKLARIALVAAPLSLLQSLSHAAAGAAVDVADTVSTIGAQLVPIGLIGVGILGVTVAVAAFVWVKKGIK